MKLEAIGPVAANARLGTLRVGPVGGDCFWHCDKSPIDICIYHPPTDPGFYDRCIFCEQPLERK